MTSLRTLMLACTFAALGACSIGRPFPSASTYAIDPPMPNPQSAVRSHPAALRIGNVRVVPAFAHSALVYRVHDVEFTADPYSAFITDPAGLFASRMAQWLDLSREFVMVAQPGSTLPAAYVLEATIVELYGDFRPGQPPAAVLSIQFALLDERGTRPKLVLERTLGARVALQSSSPDALVKGYGAALSQLLTELVVEINDKGQERASTGGAAAAPPL